MNKLSASNIDVKKINRINVVKAILSHDRISQPELTHELAISWPTVLQNVKDLIEMGLVEEVGAFASTGGRRARAFSPVRDSRLALGIDITQNHVGLVMVNIAGDLVRFTRNKKPFSMSDEYFRELGEAVNEFVEESGVEREKIVSAGMSVPGIVNEKGNYIYYSHVLKLENVSAAMFIKYIPFNCQLINDANAAGLAEMHGQASQKNAFYVSLSNSLGGAILTSGSFYMGDNLRAGEVGHNTLYPDGDICYCGKSGCSDAYCSAKVLSRHTDGDLHVFFEKVKCGDENFVAIWQKYLRDLSCAVNNIRMIFDCDIILGGYVGGYLEEYEYELKKLVSARNTFGYDASYLNICKYKLEASAVGAALSEIDKFIQII